MADVHGNYSIPIEIAESLQPHVLAVKAEVNHPLCKTSTVLIKAEVPIMHADGTPQRIRRDLAVERVFPIEGRLSTAEGANWSTAEVIVVNSLNGPQPLMHIDRASVEETGAFRALLSEWPQDAVAVVALLSHSVPEYREFLVQKMSVTDVGLIEFTSGVSISGQVLTSLPKEARSTGLSLQGGSGADGILFSSIHSGTFIWPASGLPVARLLHTDVQEDGSFFFGGLVPGNYFLSLSQPCQLATNLSTLTVTAPAVGVILEDSSAVYTVAAIEIGTGKEIRPVKLMWDHIPNFGCWVGSTWDRRVSLPPRVEHSGWLIAEGFSPEKVLLPALEPGMTGRVTVPLIPLNGPPQEEATLLSISDDEGRPVTGLLISIELDARSDTTRKYSTQQYLQSPKGLYTLPPLSPGNYVVHLNANTITHLFRSPLAIYSFNHTVPQDSGARRDVVLIRGGAVVVALRAQDSGEWVSGNLSITGPGVTGVLEWIPNDDGIIEVYFGWAPGRGEVRLRNALLDGEYKLVASADGFQTAERNFTISEARETRLEIDLIRIE